jgi:hypothetical protein
MIRLPHIPGPSEKDKVEQIIQYLRLLATEVQRLQADKGEQK